MSEELFNVVQYFGDDTYEYVRRNVPAQEAVEAAHHYTHNVSSRMGWTAKVMITDNSDYCCFLWERDKGIVFPKPRS